MARIVARIRKDGKSKGTMVKVITKKKSSKGTKVSAKVRRV